MAGVFVPNTVPCRDDPASAWGLFALWEEPEAADWLMSKGVGLERVIYKRYTSLERLLALGFDNRVYRQYGPTHETSYLNVYLFPRDDDKADQLDQSSRKLLPSIHPPEMAPQLSTWVH